MDLSAVCAPSSALLRRSKHLNYPNSILTMLQHVRRTLGLHDALSATLAFRTAVTTLLFMFVGQGCGSTGYTDAGTLGWRGQFALCLTLPKIAIFFRQCSLRRRRVSLLSIVRAQICLVLAANSLEAWCFASRTKYERYPGTRDGTAKHRRNCALC